MSSEEVAEALSKLGEFKLLSFLPFASGTVGRPDGAQRAYTRAGGDALPYLDCLSRVQIQLGDGGETFEGGDGRKEIVELDERREEMTRLQSVLHPLVESIQTSPLLH